MAQLTSIQNNQKDYSGFLVLLFLVLMALTSIRLNATQMLIPLAGSLFILVAIGTLPLAFALRIIERIEVNRLIFPIACVFVLYAFTTSFANMEFNREILIRSVIILYPILATLILVYNDKNCVKTFWQMCYFLVGFGIFLTIMGAIIIYFGTITRVFDAPMSSFQAGPLLLQVHHDGFGNVIRMSSLIGNNPNSYAGVAMYSIMALVGLKLGQKIKTPAFIVLFLILFSGILATFSRTSIAATMAGLCLLYVFKDQGISGIIRNAMVLLLILISFIVVLAFTTQIVDIFVQITKERGLSGRNVMWAIAYDSISNNPLWGVGFGVSEEAVLQKQGIYKHHLHSAYLKILTELGVIGFFLFLILMMAGLFFGFRIILQKKYVRSSYRLPVLICASLIVMSLIHSLAEITILQNNFRHYLFFYVFGVMTYQYSKNMTF